jgi:hypothetical protein
VLPQVQLLLALSDLVDEHGVVLTLGALDSLLQELNAIFDFLKIG